MPDTHCQARWTLNNQLLLLQTQRNGTTRENIQTNRAVELWHVLRHVLHYVENPSGRCPEALTLNFKRQAVAPSHVQPLCREGESRNLSPRLAADRRRKAGADIRNAATRVEHEQAFMAMHFR